jgi:hypothetical protein
MLKIMGLGLSKGWGLLRFGFLSLNFLDRSGFSLFSWGFFFGRFLDWSLCFSFDRFASHIEVWFTVINNVFADPFLNFFIISERLESLSQLLDSIVKSTIFIRIAQGGEQIYGETVSCVVVVGTELSDCNGLCQILNLLELSFFVVVLVFGEGGFIEVEELFVLSSLLEETFFTVDFVLLLWLEIIFLFKVLYLLQFFIGVPNLFPDSFAAWFILLVKYN